MFLRAHERSADPGTTSANEEHESSGDTAFNPSPQMFLRHQACKELRDLLARSPVASLIGPVGVGKTYVANRVASSERSAIRTDCERLTSEGEVLLAVARQLSVTPRDAPTDEELATRIAAELKRREVSLIALDHLVREACPKALPRALEAAGISLLLISRCEINSGFPAYWLAPLQPAQAELYLRSRIRLLGGNEDDEDPQTLYEIAKSVDGLPLALNVVAASCVICGTVEVARRLEQLGVEDRLEAALESAFHDLSTGDQNLLAAYAEFHGVFDLDAAEAVAPDTTIAAIMRLRRSSLLEIDASTTRRRYRLLRCVRAFVGRSHAPDPDAQSRHTAYFQQQVQRLVEKLQREAHGVLEAHEEARADFNAAFSRCDDDSLGEMAVSWANLLRAFGDVPALTSLLERALERATTRRVELLILRAQCRAEQGDLGPARRDIDDAERAAQTNVERRLVDERRLRFHWLFESLDDVLDAAREVAVVARNEGDTEALATALLTQAFVMHSRGIRRPAAALARRSIQDELSPYERAVRYIGLGSILIANGEIPDAIEFLSEAAHTLQSLGNQRYSALAETHLAMASILKLGSLSDQTEEILRQAAWRHEATGDRILGWVPLLYRSVGLFLNGDLVEAANAVSSANAKLLDLETTNPNLEAHRGVLVAMLGFLHAAQGKTLEAKRLVAKAERLSTRAEVALLRRFTALWEAQGLHEAGDHRRAAALFEASINPPVDRQTLHPFLRPIADRVLGDSSFWAIRHDVRPPDENTLYVGPNSCWYRAPQAEVVDLRRRQTVSRLLDVLVRARLDQPEVPLSPEALFAEAWVGERASEAALRNRVRVAIAELRRRGLKPWLLSRKGGYYLSPELVVKTQHTSEALVA
ncbi:MAG: ATP-binding protein [Myxococcota bacterium]